MHATSIICVRYVCFSVIIFIFSITVSSTKAIQIIFMIINTKGKKQLYVLRENLQDKNSYVLYMTICYAAEI